jgi:hypothetical protein
MKTLPSRSCLEQPRNQAKPLLQGRKTTKTFVVNGVLMTDSIEG